MSYFTHDFVAEIALHAVGKSRVITYKVLFMPPRFETEVPFKTYPRLRVEGEIADVPVRGAWMPVGDGRRYFIVSPDITANTGLDVGDEVEMRFRIDDQDYVDVPSALTAALKSDDAASAQWDKLTAGRKRMFTNHVFSAKTSSTEQRRVDEAMVAIKDEITLRDMQKRKR
ncbi:YdeI/OmpD-associated family protein [uncultured Roseobacter sp.]|uniref:YdeI/OmpD-associated family protein n=1 Tax=uncultured Roseobacter sp. TaxID=114847 RepID=UPI0026396598|nr:YdeI/OmpD-associated family protein [uncultured Roseobacter sp.]